MNLYHFTCHHLGQKIRDEGVIRPVPQPDLDGNPMVWLADISYRRKHLMNQLGLTWHTVRESCMDLDFPCDPVAVRFTVVIDIADHPHVIPFSTIAKDYPRQAAAFRKLPGAKPWRWWIATRPIRIRNPAPTLAGGTRV